MKFQQKPVVRTTPFSRAHKVRTKFDTSKPIEFVIGDKVVVPEFGVGQVASIESKEIASNKISFYVIKILKSDVIVYVPVDKVDARKVRPIVNMKQVDEVYSMLRDKKIVVEQSTWNRRSREYNEKIKTGCVFEIAEVLRDLYVIRAEKQLSFGEKKMLELAKSRLVRELAIAESTDELTVEAQIEGIFGVAA